MNRTYVVAPSLGLGYLASFLRPENSVTLLHCAKERLSLRDFKDFLDSHHFDLIGFQMMTYDLLPAQEQIKIIRESKNKNCTIVAGGPHPSGDPAGTMNFLPDLDYAFKGEAENGLREFVKLLKEKRLSSESLLGVSGLIWRDGAKICVNKVEFIEDLDSLPFPAWDLMNPSGYPRAPHGAFYKKFPAAPIILTRGCPSQCTFCAGKAITGNKIRKRSVENVVEEIKYLMSKFNVFEFMIEDENFTLHRDLVLKFCKRLIDEKLNIFWGCPSGVRLDTLDLEMVQLMEKSGCHSFSVGIEFGSQRILDLSRKQLRLSTIKEKIKMIRETKIKITGFFMMGIPGETLEEMEKTAKFSRELDIDRAQFNNFMPLPGSRLFDELVEKNEINDVDTNRFFVHDVAYVPKGLTAEQLKNLQRRAYLRFYLRFSILWRLLKEIDNPAHLARLLYRFFDAIR
jgi:radical SAM superfamily enzyme YgiQ (UPF0313 family)